MYKNFIKLKIIAVITLFLLSSISVTASYNKNLGLIDRVYQYTNDKLDLQYIHNISENLSDIIFTEYEPGEIAKGRAYGTKGEHRAAEILFENMSKLGLWTRREKIENTEKNPLLTHEVEIIDYFVKINNKTVGSYIAPVWIKTSENNDSINHTYNYTNLKVIEPPLFPSFYILKQRILGKLEPFVLLLKNKAFCTDGTIVDRYPALNNFYVSYYGIRVRQKIATIGYSMLWNRYMQYCKGILFYDMNDSCHDMQILKNSNYIPFIYINGTNGKEILEDIDDSRIDFKLEQRLNKSVVSYNVIGQLNGSDPSKTVLVDCLYDSWWCQGTADSAIGMAMVMGVAKYFVDHNITPKYNIKFIGFSGEEHGFCAGSRYYEDIHSDENIIYVFDLNQLGFWQKNDPLTLNIICNKLGFLAQVWHIVKKANYGPRVNSSDKAAPVLLPDGGPSNSGPFAQNRKDCKTVCFLKDGGWKLHHRDGLNHTEGDVMKYFDPEDVNITGEIVLNVIKYLTTDWKEQTSKSL